MLKRDDGNSLSLAYNAAYVRRLLMPFDKSAFLSMLDQTRRILVVLALAFWIGGLSFYAGVVVPIGTQILGSVEQGFVTQQVTGWLNLVAAGACVILMWDILRDRSRTKLAAFAIMLVCQIALFLLHPKMDALLDPPNRVVLDSPRFYTLHRVYLWTTSLLWVAGLTYLCAVAGRSAPQAAQKNS